MPRVFAIFSSFALFFTCGCSLNPYFVGDPTTILGIGPKPSSIVKALRCEVMTFIVANRLRASLRKLFDEEVTSGKLSDPSKFAAAVATIKRYRYIDIDPAQLAAIILDFKNTDTFGATFSDDRKVPTKIGSKAYHWGAGYTDTTTYELGQPYGVNQGGDLGPARTAAPKPLPGDNLVAAAFSTIYLRHDVADEDFYCYKSLANSKSLTLRQVIDEIQLLVEHGDGSAAFEHFTRITVGLRGITLAKWLQEVAEDMALNSGTIHATTEQATVGQLFYVFTLDAKPAGDLKYTLIADLINPRIPAVTASIEHLGAFSLYMSSPNALAVLGAKTGNSAKK